MADDEFPDEDFEDINPGEPRPLILPEGYYPARYRRKEKTRFNGDEKAVFIYDVDVGGNTVALKRYYNIDRDSRGRLIFGDGHAYRKDWIAANGGYLPVSRSKLPPKVFKNKRLFIYVRTVKKDVAGPLPRSCHHSVLGKVLRPIAEDEHIGFLPLQVTER